MTTLLDPIPTESRPVPTMDIGILFAEHRARMVALARTIVHCPHAAEDVVQDAMLAAMKAASGFKGHAAAATWLHRIVVNAALMHLRRGRSRPEIGFDTLDALPHAVVDPASAAELRDAVQRARACLAEIPPIQRNVIEMRDIQGLATAAVAAALGISENATKIRLHRARKSLRVAFDATGPRRDRADQLGRVVAMPKFTAGNARAAG